MTHSGVWDMIYSCVTWFFNVRHDSFIRPTRLIHMWDMAHFYVRHDSFVCVTWLIHMSDMTHSYAVWLIRLWHDAFVCHMTYSFVTWLTHTYDMTRLFCIMSHIWMSHVTHMNGSCPTYEWFKSHMWISHVTHTNESHDAYEYATSLTQISRVTRMNKPCHSHEWVMFSVWMSHITHIMVHIWYELAPYNIDAIYICVTYDSSHVPYMNESHHTYNSAHLTQTRTI